MEELNQLKGEVVKLRADVLYLIRLVEKFEKRMEQLERKIDENKQPHNPFAGMNIEKL